MKRLYIFISICVVIVGSYWVFVIRPEQKEQETFRQKSEEDNRQYLETLRSTLATVKKASCPRDKAKLQDAMELEIGQRYGDIQGDGADSEEERSKIAELGLDVSQGKYSCEWLKKEATASLESRISKMQGAKGE